MKLEKGNKPTAWTPAPEDLETEVTSLKTDYATYKQTTTEALSEIGTTYATKTELGTETSNRQTAIQQANDAIALKANSTDVYTKTQADGKVTEAVNAAKAEIKVTTDGISSEVEKKTDKASIISTIRQSAEDVKIKASQVEIDGTAIFSAISSDVDDAITGKGYATTTQVSTALDDAKDYVDGKGYQTAGDVSAAISTGTANLAAKADAIARTQRIWYRQTESGAKPGKNLAWLSTSGTGYGNWSLTVPQMTDGSTKYPKLYTAVQSQTVAQQAAGTTCACSDVQLDDSTTVIDGGNIITGSVTANQIAGHSVSADQLTVGVNDSIADAAKTASNYIAADSTGIRIANANPSTAATYQHQTSEATEYYIDSALRNRVYGSGMELFTGDAGSEVSATKFISGQARIGEADGMKTVVGEGEFKIVDPSNTLVTRVVSYNTHDGLAWVSMNSTGDGSKTMFYAVNRIDPTIGVRNCYYLDGSTLEAPTISGDYGFVFATPPEAKQFRVEYASADQLFSATFGTRRAGQTYGSNSLCIGKLNVASASTAAAIGADNYATANHAYAIGRANTSSATDSYAIGRGLKASSQNQMVIGKYNVEDTAGTYSFIIGNGTSDSDRSNIFTVNTDGYVSINTENKENVNKGFRVNDLSSAGRSLIVGIGKGTVNRGIYDEKLDRWMVYANDSTVYVNNIEIADSGWLNLPIASGWTAYSSGWTPRYRKKNGMVEVRGGIKPTSATTLGESVAVFGNLPSGYRPEYEFTTLCQGSGRKIWLLHIYTDGRVSAERYRDMASSSYQSASTSEWMIFHATFFAD